MRNDLVESLHNFIRHDDLVTIKQMLLKNPELVNKKSIKDRFPIHTAVYTGSIEIIKLLLNYGANVNSKDSLGETPLHIACRQRFTEIAIYLIDSGANINSVSKVNFTPLHFSCIYKQIQIAEYLLYKGVDLNKKSNGNTSPVFLAAARGWLEFIQKLYKLNKTFDTFMPDGTSLLSKACLSDNYLLVEFLLKQGFDVNNINSKNETPLHNACMFGRLNIIELLLNNGANPNITENSVYKYCHNNRELINFLIEKRIKVSDYDSYSDEIRYKKQNISLANDSEYNENINNDPFIKSCLQDNLKSVKYDLEKGQVSEQIIAEGIITAIKYKNYNVLNYFISTNYVNNENLRKVVKDNMFHFNYFELHHRLNINFLPIYLDSINNYNKRIVGKKTALHYAIIKRDKIMVKLLLERGSDPDLVGSDEQIPPLFLSYYMKQPEITSLLLEFGADINIKSYGYSDDGNTLLIKAIEKGEKLEYIINLLENGADVNLSNRKGETALHWSCIKAIKIKSSDSIKLIETLIKYGADINAKTKILRHWKEYFFPYGSTPLDIIKIKNARKIEKVLLNYL